MITFDLNRSSQRRNLTIFIEENGSVNVSVPFNCSQRAIHTFLHEKAKWIINRIQKAKEEFDYINSRAFDDGHSFLFLGRKYEIRVIEEDIKRSRLDFDGQKWTVYVPVLLSKQERREHVRERMIKWYRLQAKEVLGSRIFHYSRIMDEEPLKIDVRTQKRLWGCCDYDKKAISLNWQIVMSPLSVIDYVVVHELCHLKIPNHSRRFWKKVEKFMPDYSQRRRWLKDNNLDLVLPQ